MRKSITSFALAYGIAASAFGGTILGIPEYQLPGMASPVPFSSPPFPVGPSIYLWPADTLKFSQTGAATLFFTTDAAPGESTYNIDVICTNNTPDHWSGIRYEIVAAGDDSAVSLDKLAADDDVVVDTSFLSSGFSNSQTLFLSFGATAPPQQFQLTITPVANVPEPASSLLLACGGLMLLHRSRQS